MASLADKAILSGADNRPPMLEKDMYDSWRSRMELYKLNRQHDRMILESVEHGPLLWPTVEEDGVTRLKKYSEFTHKVAKDLWERIQMLMQGTSLTKQERECKLYDAFDKFAYQKGETLCDFYLRFSLLLNDMNMYNMKLEQFQVNIKFLNTLPSEWRKFVTDVKLVRDLHTTNVNQLHAYLEEQVQADDAVAAAVQETVVEDVANEAIPSTPTPHFTITTISCHSIYFSILDTCSDLTRRVENLEHDKSAQKLEIIKLKARVKRMERANKVKSSKLRRLKKVETSQRIESSDDMEDVFNQGRMIDDLDKMKGLSW
nr:hypothetical protein [Tanacetum cinerariifolium]